MSNYQERKTDHEFHMTGFVAYRLHGCIHTERTACGTHGHQCIFGYPSAALASLNFIGRSHYYSDKINGYQIQRQRNSNIVPQKAHLFIIIYQ